MENLYLLKVYPKGRGREAYRKIEVTGNYKLDDLCEAIIYAFNFTFDHMYEFCMDNKLPSQDCYVQRGMFGERSTHISLDKLKLVPKQKFTLHYDFGDDWQFIISVQKIEEYNYSRKPTVVFRKGEVEQYPDYDEGFF